MSSQIGPIRDLLSILCMPDAGNSMWKSIFQKITCTKCGKSGFYCMYTDPTFLHFWTYLVNFEQFVGTVGYVLGYIYLVPPIKFSYH